MSRRPLQLWFDRPANDGSEALPVGNGRLGAMVFGRPLRREDYHAERLVLNEDSLWYGGPSDRVNPEARAHLPRVRELLLAGRVRDAEDLADLTMTGVPRHHRPFQMLAELMLFGPDHAACTDYRRELDLQTATCSTAYRMDGAVHERQVFCTAVDQLLVLRLKGRVDCGAYLRRRPFDQTVRRIDDRTVAIEGQAGPDGVTFAVVLRALCTDANARVGVLGQCLNVAGASDVTFLVAANTSFRTPDPLAASLAQIESGCALGFDALWQRHVKEHQGLFKRLTFELDTDDPSAENLPTDQRLARLRDHGADPGLTALMVQYSRYLLLACSRPGTLPANLQGLWNDSFTPPWFCNYTTDINLQMNYWSAEVCNLPECHEPLLDYLERVRIDGQRTAERMYGCRGFVVHHTLDLWADTAPSYGVHGMALWPTGGAWLALHAWDHFCFSPDEALLRQRVYPLLRDASLFFLDYLVTDARGQLVTAPSASPENLYRLPDGQTARMCVGPTMDNQILAELFAATSEAGRLLGDDPEFLDAIDDARRRLPPTRINADGRIAEWLDDVSEVDPHHRHLSHLFGLYPGTSINPHTMPELAQAARRTIELRFADAEVFDPQAQGHGLTEWTLAWMMNIHARLGEGDAAHVALTRLLNHHTLPNLLTNHPPFQIDGNFGAAAGIVEMLLQSHAGAIRFLPALPAAWPSGHVTGLRARGGCVVDLRWHRGRATQARVRSTRAQPLELTLIAPPGESIIAIESELNGSPVDEVTLTGASARMLLAPGLAYRVRFRDSSGSSRSCS